ncbi:MAG: class I SAM-dependent DNA methyltransferase [Bacteroidetes bacterium]|nr:MAG: class I SAM-dependent DNA methyltransferase [Bacteroidota bacterium]REK07662.1 MAG: class I SAM-dependent DNA methyltransferase [Bacteroidota bacterium]REK33738.1 MAG: class I SAM-dependent DNA methyltransferase [Bacteroidota bacterium]REK49208.1 MAG: class I SAM-dependent DNA methyltransferase [Bacteroidota bacterium]
MTLSWNEIKERALKFSKEWADTSNEEADAKPFLVEFFNVFGITSKRVSTFEHRVKKLDDKDGYIDLLWKGTILIEMKSRGKNLDKAFEQAKDYLHGLKEHELPKYILISDFENFRFHDLEETKTIEFKLNDLVNNVQHFGYLLGYQKKVYKEQDPANIKAAELMGKLHDRLEEIGYTGHPLEVYLVRILFCLFAEDTTIFNKQQFQEYIEQRTNIDGSDLAAKLQELFQVLNTLKEKRFKNLDEQLADFPYVNGKLFEEILPTASFDTKMRQALLNCCYIDWSKISPAIFGSMFQSVMNPKERRNLGAHYTSETNILKLIKPIFLDELWKEFESVKDNKNKLPEFHKKLSTLKFLDPACGCGNFLVITYRELRLLEFEVLKTLNKSGQTFLDVSQILWINVDQFSGIEYKEFPARIAEVAMWLIDHQMNMLVSSEFGQYFVRLPLKKSANIVHADALETDWENVISKNELSYIIGNPPFIGHQWRNEAQMKGMEKVFGDAKRAGRLDYVAAWYLKAAQYIQDTKIKVAFVSTNSITQGEQAIILWPLLFNKYNIKIHFAHRTFSWSNEAKGNAGVHVVIVGFANFDISEKRLFEYEDIKGEAHEISAKNINAYLVDAKDILIESRGKPIHQFPEMFKGSQPTDGGHLIINSKEDFLKSEPNASKYIKRYMGADDFISSKTRWCLWLKNADPKELKNLPRVLERLEKVKETRLQSPTPSVIKFAEFPSLFTQDRQPNSNYLVLPEVSSENRKYIPVGFETKDVICANTVQIIPNANLYLFGVLQSLIHMTWAKTISGKLESRIRYTPAVYNNYPFPQNPSDKQVKAIEIAAQKVLDARLQFPTSSLADLYDPLTMPPALIKAHNELDKAVDLAYRPQPFSSEANRMEFLFGLYEKYTADLFTKMKVKKLKR